MMLFNLHVLTADPRGHVRIRDAMQGIQIDHEVNRGQMDRRRQRIVWNVDEQGLQRLQKCCPPRSS